METFFTALAIYFIGMLIIGLPLGILSLKAWKYPEKLRLLGWLCFPFSTFSDELGKPLDRTQDFGYAPLLEGMGVSKTIHEDLLEAREARAQYIVATMLLWPLRFILVMFMFMCIGLIAQGVIHLFALVIRLGALASKFGSKLILKCQRCVDV